MKFLLLAIVLTAAGVSAAPSPPANTCGSGVLGIIEDILRLLPRGTPFCSSYLDIATVTSTILPTKASVTSYTSTSTSTVTVSTAAVSTLVVPYVKITTTGTSTTTDISTATAAATSIVTTVSVSEIVSTVTASTPTTTTTTTLLLNETFYSLYPPPTANPTANSRRSLDERGIAIPSQLISYAGSEISSACSCLHLPTPTTTTTAASVTKTIFAVATTITTVTSTNPVLVTSTQTIISAVGASATIGETLTTTNTVTATTESVSSTVYITVVTPPASTVTSTSTVYSVTVTTDPCSVQTGVLYHDKFIGSDGVSIFDYGYYTEDVLVDSADATTDGCCRKCYNTPGCAVAIAEDNAYCLLILNAITPVVDANAQCPTGYDVVDSFSGGTIGLPSPNTPDEMGFYGWTVGPCFAGTLS